LAPSLLGPLLSPRQCLSLSVRRVYACAPTHTGGKYSRTVVRPRSSPLTCNLSRWPELGWSRPIRCCSALRIICSRVPLLPGCVCPHPCATPSRA
jgi:hypothetical protein